MCTPLTSEPRIALRGPSGAGGAGAGGGEKMLESSHCNRGGPCTHTSGIASNKLNARACIVNDTSVLQRRRADLSHVVSSV